MPSSSETSTRRERLVAASALLVVVALAILLRAYRLSDQSLWFDEYATVDNLAAPDLLSHHALMRIHYPDQAAGPLYYSLQYLYAMIAGTDLLVLRLLSIFISLLNVILIYVLGKRLYGRQAGLLAALCLAMSPQHIWWGQEPRAYEFITLLVIVSSIALFRAIESGSWRWWTVNLTVNALLPWTHPMAVLFLPVQGLVLLVVFRHRIRSAFLWTGTQFLFLSPWACWMLLMPRLSSDQHSPGIQLMDVARAVLTGDIVASNTSLVPPWKMCHPGTSLQQMLLAWNNTLTSILLAVFALALLYLLARLVLVALKSLRAKPGNAQDTLQMARPLFLLFLTVVPGLILGMLEMHGGIEALQPAYSLHSTVGLYIAIGAALSSVGFRFLRVAGAILLSGLYAYQLAIFLPYTTRTNWRDGAAYIKEHGQPGDLVIDLQTCLYPGGYLQYYLRGTGFSAHRLRTLQAVCDRSRAFLVDPASASSTPQETRSVWVAFEMLPHLFNYPPEHFTSIPEAIMQSRTAVFGALEEGLAARGLVCSFKEFPGHFDLVVAHISPGKTPLPKASSDCVAWIMNIEFDRLLDSLNIVCPTDQARQETIATLRATIPMWPSRMTVGYVLEAIDLIAASRPDLALAFARDIVEHHPDYGVAHFLLALALAAEEEDTDAQAEFRKAFALHWGLKYIYSTFVTLWIDNNIEALRAEECRLESMGHDIFYPATRVLCEMPPL